MSNADEFIDKYKILENLIRKKFNIDSYNDSAIAKIEVLPQFRSIKEELQYARSIRNLLSHNSKINGNYPIEPNIELVKNLDRLIAYIDKPPKAYDKCIKITNVFHASWDDKIYPIMQEMKKNSYTHVPILNNGVVEGVFSENTLFGALIEEELIYDKISTTFSNDLIKKHTLINNHVSETFVFVKKDLLLEDAKDLFNKSFGRNERLSVLFITENGKETEKLLGILTPWDIL